MERKRVGIAKRQESTADAVVAEVMNMTAEENSDSLLA